MFLKKAFIRILFDLLTGFDLRERGSCRCWTFHANCCMLAIDVTLMETFSNATAIRPKQRLKEIWWNIKEPTTNHFAANHARRNLQWEVQWNFTRLSTSTEFTQRHLKQSLTATNRSLIQRTWKGIKENFTTPKKANAKYVIRYSRVRSCCMAHPDARQSWVFSLPHNHLEVFNGSSHAFAFCCKSLRVRSLRSFNPHKSTTQEAHRTNAPADKTWKRSQIQWRLLGFRAVDAASTEVCKIGNNGRDEIDMLQMRQEALNSSWTVFAHEESSF